MALGQFIDELRLREDCVVANPIGVPAVRKGHSLPDDLAAFYVECGGIRFQAGIAVVAPERFLPANDVVLDEPFPDDPSQSWYVVAESDESGTAERISIDLRPTHLGRCYDSFWDRYGVAGSMAVVATSFTSFLRRVATEGRFWTAEGFAPLGDAYDE